MVDTPYFTCCDIVFVLFIVISELISVINCLLNIMSTTEDFHATPPDIVNAAKSASLNLLPEKSRAKYEAVYKKFNEWRVTKNANSLSENVLMAYFDELSKTLAPNTMWSHYSMLKSTINSSHDVDIPRYKKLQAFLKRKNTGFIPKKSKILTPEDISKFLNEAPDDRYLATKVALIIGINGACRREELVNITVNDITDYGSSMVLIKLPRTKTHIQRSFTVTDDFYKIFQKYRALRPVQCCTPRFFLNYQNGKCTQQPIGIIKFGNMPKEIATYLNLPDPHHYTGHSFRRTSATLLANSGADMSTIKRHGGWSSDKIAEGYVEQSVNNKRRIEDQIVESINLNLGPSSMPEVIDENSNLEKPPVKLMRFNSNDNLIVIDDAGKPQDEVSTIVEQSVELREELVDLKKHYHFEFKNCSNISINITKN